LRAHGSVVGRRGTSRPVRETWCTPRGDNGTPSGTRETSLAESSRSFPPPASNGSSRSLLSSAASRRRARSNSAFCASASHWIWIPTACPDSCSASTSASRQSH
jgi:hypothetical protein